MTEYRKSSKIISQKFFLLALRGSGILGKFLLTFLLTKKISLEFQGSFALISTTITLLCLLFGFDFYVYSNKSLIRDKERAVYFLKNSLVFIGFLYIVLCPFIFGASYLFFADSAFTLTLFFSVVLLEHLGLEFFRIYIALNRVVLANILLFIRTGLWAILIVGYLFFVKEPDFSINYLLIAWSSSALLSVILSFYYFPLIEEFFKQKVDLLWIKKGIKVAAQMFLATIFLKVVEFSDRYIIDLFHTREDVGIYTFYYQLANLANVIIFTLFISFIYPSLIEAVFLKNFAEVKRLQRKIKANSLTVIAALGVVYIISIPFILSLVARPILYDYILLLFVLLAANLLNNLSYAGHYTLIGYNEEKKILKVTFICFVASLSLNLILIKLLGVWGAGFSQVATMFLMFYLKDKMSARHFEAT